MCEENFVIAITVQKMLHTKHKDSIKSFNQQVIYIKTNMNFKSKIASIAFNKLRIKLSCTAYLNRILFS